ncbi:hypothetical protein [Bosea sp. 685]|uniref:hypothetical protein n=1 Tax=Bosea sp. 685 TaxID=3080057 RepID=UPI00289370A0|nr:hypothetical protein [Bosea sp. 685]WNJ92712.1 hypothetical protein RMR04_10600 [Bosea sp. 685]
MTSFAIASAGRKPFEPLLDASKIAIEAPDRGRIVKSSSFNSPGETARLVRDDAGHFESV